MPVTEDEIRKGVCFLCVFALDDLDSFEKTGFFIEKIRTVNPNNPPIVLIGNDQVLLGTMLISFSGFSVSTCITLCWQTTKANHFTQATVYIFPLDASVNEC